ncbi:outer membrane beta-barrel family protein [Pleomorphovibrio marinus]|uniref:outer membrane beta-barrel family protein n=1 Tax=Pleomorphovibrio marinus TaxID=2164132 RepID=UPI000E0A9543|nr:outer membrane beta-barrel family protein [Pleomorphovibrio marinus]
MKAVPFFFACYFAFFTQISFAQETTQTVSGQLISPLGEPLLFANISLKLEEGGDLVAGVVSDESGLFLIRTQRTGKFFLSISSMGYETIVTPQFELGEGENLDLGEVTMEEIVSDLSEVTVQAARAQISIEADKTVVNIEGSVMAEGNTALEVLGRSPGIFVDADGNISLNGRSGVIVLLDDRQTYMSAEDLANFLRAMPADNIKSIEIINNPPARYDAEGAGGVINIKLKKNTVNGTNGSLNMGTGYNGLHAPFGGANINVKRGKWSTSASLNYSDWARYQDIEIFRRFQLEEGLSAFDQNARLKLVRSNYFFNGAADYQINDQHSVGFNLQASMQDGKEDGLSETLISNPTTSALNNLEALNDSRSGNNRNFGNLHYVGKLDTLGTKITADIDFTRMDADSRSMLNNRYWINDDTANVDRDRILTNNWMNYSIFTAKVDFTKPLGNGGTLEAGVKGSWVKSDNDLDIAKSAEEGPFLPDPSSNHFIYQENVLAAYTNFQMPLGDKFNLQAGLRAEYSDILGNSITMNQQNVQQYLDFFPNLNLQHKISDNYQIVYNANRRITRPNYRLLNPFVFYIDPLTMEIGNPNLTPQYANNFEMNHIIKGAYQVALSYARTYNAFGQILTQEEDTRMSFIQMQNLDVTQHLNLRVVFPIEVSDSYSISNMVQGNANTFQAQLGDELLDVSQLSMMARTQHNLVLPDGWKMELTGMYLSPFREGQLKLKAVAWVDAGVTKTFKNNLSVTVNGTDLLRSQRFRGNILFDNINTDVAQYNHMQGVRLTLRWKFAQGENFRVSQRSGSTEERDRLE